VEKLAIDPGVNNSGSFLLTKTKRKKNLNPDDKMVDM
jgi:hypothetical protein